jgi:glycine oxidase
VREHDILVIGGGVIGLAIAWRIAQRSGGSAQRSGGSALRSGRVAVLDPDPGSGASWTAAGMLAPATELYYGEHGLYALNAASASRYPGFVADLEQASGRPVGYVAEGTLLVGWDSADAAAIHDLHRFHRTLAIDTQMLTGRELRALEPGLASGLPGGLLAPNDHQIDNRLLHSALAIAAEAAGVTMIRSRVEGICVRDGAAGPEVRGVTLPDGHVIPASTVVLAGGAWSRLIEGLPIEVLPAVRPVKGQTLRVRVDGDPLLTRTVRARVLGGAVYVVPRTDGRLVIGASSEETGFGTEPRVGAIHDLLRDAITVLPALDEAVWEEVSTSLRPGTPDNAPLIGRTGVDGLILATGHYRNGILLTPITADAVVALIHDESPPAEVVPFTPGRFAATAQEATRCD